MYLIIIFYYAKLWLLLPFQNNCCSAKQTSGRTFITSTHFSFRWYSRRFVHPNNKKSSNTRSRGCCLQAKCHNRLLVHKDQSQPTSKNKFGHQYHIISHFVPHGKLYLFEVWPVDNVVNDTFWFSSKLEFVTKYFCVFTCWFCSFDLANVQ